MQWSGMPTPAEVVELVTRGVVALETIATSLSNIDRKLSQPGNIDLEMDLRKKPPQQRR